MKKALGFNSEAESSLSAYVENMVLFALAEEQTDRFEGLPESDRGKKISINIINGFQVHREMRGVHALYRGVQIRQDC